MYPSRAGGGAYAGSYAATTRGQVLATLAGSKKKVFAYHLPWPGIGHVRRNGEGYEWVAEVYAIPG